MAFFIDEARDLAVAQIPRCGIQTFKIWLGDSFRVVDNDDPALMTVTRRVVFIRDPRERLKSAFSLMYWSREYGRPHRAQPNVTDWQNFVDYVLDSANPDDLHWMQQVDIFSSGIPTVIHKFENLLNHWQTYRPGILQQRVHFTRPATPDYRIPELAAKYAEDFTIWQGAD